MLEPWMTLNKIHRDLDFCKLGYINPETEFQEPKNFGGLYKIFLFRIRNGISIFYCMMVGLGKYFVIELLSSEESITVRLKIIFSVIPPTLVFVFSYLISIGFLYYLYNKKLH